MPGLFHEAGGSAFRGLVRNKAARWTSVADPASERRVGGPAFKPELNPKFKLDISSSTFAMGSCFAENIQHALSRRGISVDSYLTDTSDCGESSWFVPMEYRETGSSYPGPFFHRYNLPSMEQEISRLLGVSDKLAEEALIMRVNGREFRDFHYHEHFPLESLESSVARRRYVQKKLSNIKYCDLFIITLGLTEAWYDHKAGLYLNTAPPWSAVSAESGRYEFRVLDWPTLLVSSRNIVEMITAVRPNVRVVVTVSPIPLDVTFTRSDVAVATMHSKATLLSVANQLASDYEGVDYFPSYEMAMLSDREKVWEPDARHVRAAFVNTITDHFIANFFKLP